VYSRPVTAGNLTVSGNLFFTDEHFQNLANSRVIKTDAYHLLDLRVAYQPTAKPWQLALSCKNCADEEYFTGGFDIAGLGIANAYMNIPRQVALEFGYTFD
jgi:outer membrane receptor protein involved in Fe transport